jgi:hypothetical protein
MGAEMPSITKPTKKMAVKPLQLGRAADNAVVSARIANRGWQVRGVRQTTILHMSDHINVSSFRCFRKQRGFAFLLRKTSLISQCAMYLGIFIINKDQPIRQNIRSGNRDLVITAEEGIRKFMEEGLV